MTGSKRFIVSSIWIATGTLELAYTASSRSNPRLARVLCKSRKLIRKLGLGWIKRFRYLIISSSPSELFPTRLNPYLNYHRPCAQADVEIDQKGRKRVRYKRYQTPLETLMGLDKPAQYLRQGLSINALKRIAGALSDTDAARRMQQAKSKLFEKLRVTA
jgi:hypothetical protein